MSKSLEMYLSILLTIAFLVLLPMYLSHYELEICTDNYDEYYLEEMAWMIESEEMISASMWDQYTKDPIKMYGSGGARLSESEVVDSKGFYKIPKSVKYVQITYGNNSRWIVYDREGRNE